MGRSAGGGLGGRVGATDVRVRAEGIRRDVHRHWQGVGARSVEYALILVLVAIVVIVILVVLGQSSQRFLEHGPEYLAEVRLRCSISGQGVLHHVEKKRRVSDNTLRFDFVVHVHWDID